MTKNVLIPSAIFVVVIVLLTTVAFFIGSASREKLTDLEVRQLLPSNAINVQSLGRGWVIFGVFDQRTYKDSRSFLFNPQHNVLVPIEGL